MADDLYKLLYNCTVKLTLANGTCGTGFFVAPGYVLTCEHVVREAGNTPIAMRWQEVTNFAEAYIEEVLPAYDLALLKFDSPHDKLPCVLLDLEFQRKDELYLFGYPEQDYPDGRPADFVCEGEFVENGLSLILLKQGQMQPGMSGAALLNCRTGKVCAMAKLTRDRDTDLGGGGVAVSVILEKLPQIIELQKAFHQKDKRWQSYVAIQRQNLTRKVASSQAQVSTLKAEMYQIHSQSSGSKIELNHDTLMGLIQKISEIDNNLFELMKDL